MTRLRAAKARPVLGRRANREARRAQIIDAALQILAYEGYAAFTMRNVGARAGMTLGAVQHYFRNKNELLLALTDYKLQTDYLATEDARSKSPRSAEGELVAVVELLLRDNKKPFIHGLDFQLFAMACADRTAARCVDSFYSTVRQWFESLLMNMNPSLSHAQCRSRVIVILSLLEGTMQVLYRDRSNRPIFGEVEEAVKREVLRIAKGD
jgi:AcrR family transcriptional regulator